MRVRVHRVGLRVRGQTLLDVRLHRVGVRVRVRVRVRVSVRVRLRLRLRHRLRLRFDSGVRLQPSEQEGAQYLV